MSEQFDDTGSLTVMELAGALARRHGAYPVTSQDEADHLARQLFEDIKASRQPEWEYGEVYRSADGRPYRFIADGEWLDCASGQKVYLPGSPPGPLVKLVPEGSQAAKVDRWMVQAEIARGGELEETDKQIADRIMKLLDGAQ